MSKCLLDCATKGRNTTTSLHKPHALQAFTEWEEEKWRLVDDTQSRDVFLQGKCRYGDHGQSTVFDLGQFHACASRLVRRVQIQRIETQFTGKVFRITRSRLGDGIYIDRRRQPQTRAPPNGRNTFQSTVQETYILKRLIQKKRVRYAYIVHVCNDSSIPPSMQQQQEEEQRRRRRRRRRQKKTHWVLCRRHPRLYLIQRNQQYDDPKVHSMANLQRPGRRNLKNKVQQRSQKDYDDRRFN